MLRIALALLATFLALPALADQTAVYKTADGQRMTISYRDDNHVRMDMNSDGYLLLTGSKIYSVSRNDNGWAAMDMAEMMRTMRQFGGAGGEADDSPNGRFEFRDTGRTERIAGYTGKVYEVITDEGTSEVVLSDHKDIRGLQRAYLAIVRAFAATSGSPRDFDESLRAAQLDGKGGFLRVDQDMILLETRRGGLAANHFELPAGTQIISLPSFGAARSAPPAASSGRAAKASEPSAREPQPREEESSEPSFASEVADEATSAAKDETKATVRDTVRDEVRSTLRGLFRR